MDKINVLVTLDENYVPQLNVMLFSLIECHPDTDFDVYLLHSHIPNEALDVTRRVLFEHGKLITVSAENIGLDTAPTTARYPAEMYYRIFAAKYLPTDIDRVLYLDPDLIVNGSLKNLYALPLDEYFFAAASHIGAVMRRINGVRLDMEVNSPYINSGVMLMNLDLLRREQNLSEVFDFIEKKKNALILPDQDVISSLYGSKIQAIDTFRYNMTERLFKLHSPFEKTLTVDWVRGHSKIIHYCGRNKPWKENYVGQLGFFYHDTTEKMQKLGLIK